MIDITQTVGKVDIGGEESITSKADTLRRIGQARSISFGFHSWELRTHFRNHRYAFWVLENRSLSGFRVPNHEESYPKNGWKRYLTSVLRSCSRNPEISKHILTLLEINGKNTFISLNSDKRSIKMIVEIRSILWKQYTRELKAITPLAQTHIYFPTDC